jgi:catechol 2,3-dioxygenase-like lactoylglutathione lyase family enzyme
MADFPAPVKGVVLTHFIVSDDVQRSRRFYTDVLGGEAVLDGEPTIVALSNGWIIINSGGGPTEDKPTVTLETPSDPDRVNSFLNIRVADIRAVYEQWRARGAGDQTQTLVVPQCRRSQSAAGRHLADRQQVLLIHALDLKSA